MTIGDMIRAYREEHGISQRRFAVQIGASNGYVSMLEKGVNPATGEPITPSLTMLCRIAMTIGVTLQELTEKADDVIVDISPISNIPGIFPPPQTVLKPLIGTIACGTPILAQENIGELVPVDASINCDFTLRCKGDSMIDAHIMDGAIVCCREQPEVENGEIAAVLIGEEATLKRVYYSDGAVTLMPANAAYPPMVYTGTELEGFRVIGKVLAWTNFLRERG